MRVLQLVKNKFLRDSAVLQIGAFITATGNFASALAMAHLLGAKLQGVFVVSMSLYSLVFFLVNVGVIQAAVPRVAVASARSDVDGVADALAFVVKGYTLVGLALFAAGWFLLPLVADLAYRASEVPVPPRTLGLYAACLLAIPVFDVPRAMTLAAFQGTRKMLALAQVENGTEAVRAYLVILGCVVTGSPVGPVVGSIVASAFGSVLALHRYRRARRQEGYPLPEARSVLARVPRVPIRTGITLGVKLGVLRNINAMVGTVLPPLLLQHFAGSATVAYYRVAARLINFPIMLMQGISRTALPALSELTAVAERDLFFRIFRKVTVLGGALIAGGLWLVVPLVPWLVELAFPPDYVEPVTRLVLILAVGYTLLAFALAIDAFMIVTDSLNMAIGIGIWTLAVHDRRRPRPVAVLAGDRRSLGGRRRHVVRRALRLRLHRLVLPETRGRAPAAAAGPGRTGNGGGRVMRILFLNDLSDPRIGSSIRQMYQEAERLRELGHETALVTATQDEGDAGETEIEGCRVFKLWSDYELRWRAWVSLDNPRVRGPFRDVLAAFRPDVVHSHLLHTHLSYASLTAAREAGAGVVFTAHDVMTFCYQKLTCFHGGEERGGELRDYPAYLAKCVPCQRLRFRPGRNRRIRSVLARDVHRFTVVSDELGRAIGANGIRVDRTVHNAIRPRRELPDAAAVEAFRERVGLAGCQVLAIGGRLHEQKGVAQLLRMLARLAPDFPKLRLIVMGRREIYDGEFAELARSLGVHDRVVPTGWLDGDELQCAYAATDVFVTPSICFDTFGLVNLEAMEHAKPVVATCFGGSPEVVRDGRTGFVVNPFDVEGSAAAIARLLSDPALAARMGREGRVRMEQHFTVDRLTDEFLEEYELALRARADAPNARG